MTYDPTKTYSWRKSYWLLPVEISNALAWALWYAIWGVLLFGVFWIIWPVIMVVWGLLVVAAQFDPRISAFFGLADWYSEKLVLQPVILEEHFGKRVLGAEIEAWDVRPFFRLKMQLINIEDFQEATAETGTTGSDLTDALQTNLGLGDVTLSVAGRGSLTYRNVPDPFGVADLLKQADRYWAEHNYRIEL